MTDKTTKQTITPEEATAVLEADIHRKAQAFVDAYTALCEAHQAHLMATPHINQGMVAAGISHVSIRGHILPIRNGGTEQ